METHPNDRKNDALIQFLHNLQFRTIWMTELTCFYVNK